MINGLRNRLIPRRLRAADRLRTPLSSPVDHGYLTDGTHLYRFVGWGGNKGFAELEDCRSFELLVISARELLSQRMRPVTPAEA